MNLATLESVKSTYIKRTIGVAKNTRLRLVYLLARETFLLEDLRTMYPLPNTTASENLLKSLIIKEGKQYLRTFMELEPRSTGIGQQQTLKCDTR